MLTHKPTVDVILETDRILLTLNNIIYFSVTMLKTTVLIYLISWMNMDSEISKTLQSQI